MKSSGNVVSLSDCLSKLSCFSNNELDINFCGDSFIDLASNFGHFGVVVVDIFRSNKLYPRYDIKFSNLPLDFINDVLKSRRCPFLKKLNSSTSPFDWSSTREVIPLQMSSGTDVIVRSPLGKLLASKEILGGQCVPVHNAHGARGAVFYFSKHHQSGKQFPNLVVETIRLYESSFGATNETNQRRKHTLTPREIECLEWVASGKTSFEISKITALSEHTVNHYMVLASEKLNTTNRAHTVAKAIRMGLLNT